MSLRRTLSFSRLTSIGGCRFCAWSWERDCVTCTSRPVEEQGRGFSSRHLLHSTLASRNSVRLREAQAALQCSLVEAALFFSIQASRSSIAYLTARLYF